jgi:hypothetical protein
MTKRYTGGVVSSAVPTVNAATASGVFLLSQQADAAAKNNWPPFKVEKSLRFRNSASARLTRTPSVSGNKQIWTVSFWLKTAKSNFDYYCFEASTDGGNNERTVLAFNGGKLQFRHIDGGSAVLEIETTQVFRDPSAWYHIVLAVDTTQATSSNRVKMYLNGSQITAFGTSSYPSQNLNTDWNGATAHAFGASNYPDAYADGYFSEIYNIDGQALTPSSFGATDKDGNWSPIAYTGTYGTNGFYLNFKDSTSAATTGYDYSGNGNNWTLNNFNVSTANTTYDIMIDVPEDQDGASVRGNYCTLNPLSPTPYGSLSNGNLLFTNAGVDWGGSKSTFAIPITGKWYAEFTIGNTSSNSAQLDMGIFSSSNPNVYDWTGSYGLEINNGFFIITNGSYSSNRGSTTAGGTVLQIAVDSDAGKVWFGVANSWYDTYNTTNGNPSAGTNPSGSGINFSTTTYFMGVKTYLNNCTANFGQRPFTYTPPTGFKTLNTFNLPEPTIKQPNKQFDVNLWTGNGTSQNITNTGVFKPDLVWVKQRNGTYRHQLVDAIRGVTRSLFSSDSDAEATYQGVTAFNSNGFSVGTELGTNENGSTFVGWQWNAGNANTTNTSGTITSIVRANPTAGFSIATYTGTGSNATIGHGLGVTPSMVTVKCRSTAGESWHTYHVGLSSLSNTVYLNGTAAEGSFPTCFNSMSTLNSTVFSLGTDTASNASGRTYVAYCFAPIAGYSAFGSYVGNSSADGAFIYTGFRPAFVLYKKSNGIDGWLIYDAKRNSYNVADVLLQPNTTGAESASGPGSVDILSNGFKHRNANNIGNSSSFTYIYAAFAEMPFKYARAR